LSRPEARFVADLQGVLETRVVVFEIAHKAWDPTPGCICSIELNRRM
jgi:hypothetical protein